MFWDNWSDRRALFGDYLERIEATRVPIVRLEWDLYSPVDAFDSKLGGDFYWPYAWDSYPRDAKGTLMIPLIQINFDQVPELVSFPTSGILQIFISGMGHNMYAYGLNYSNFRDSSGYKVIYHSEIMRDENNVFQISRIDNLLPKANRTTPYELDKSFKIRFMPSTQIIELNDFRFPKLLKEIHDNEELWNAYEGMEPRADLNLSQMGGYPSIYQADPREDEKDRNDLILLLQIHSFEYEDDFPLMWGDLGVAHFFININDLKAKDFSKVIYSWEC